MSLLRVAAVGAGLVWFLDPRSGPARRARALEAALGLAGRARAMLEGRLAGRGLAGPGEDRPGATGRARRPEVREVKSPAELEPGLFSARPVPTYSSRVDRPDLRGARGGARSHGPLPDELEPTAEDWRHGDVTPPLDLASPPQGSHLGEAHLGVYVPRDLESPARGRGERDEDEPGPRGRRG